MFGGGCKYVKEKSLGSIGEPRLLTMAGKLAALPLFGRIFGELNHFRCLGLDGWFSCEGARVRGGQ